MTAALSPSTGKSGDGHETVAPTQEPPVANNNSTTTNPSNSDGNNVVAAVQLRYTAAVQQAALQELETLLIEWARTHCATTANSSSALPAAAPLHGGVELLSLRGGDGQIHTLLRDLSGGGNSHNAGDGSKTERTLSPQFPPPALTPVLKPLPPKDFNHAYEQRHASSIPTYERAWQVRVSDQNGRAVPGVVAAVRVGT